MLQRVGANALDVIDNVKRRIGAFAGSLPKGVDIVAVYDRSTLIRAAIETLRHTLMEESFVVALVCVVFLLHVRSALVAILMLPVGVLMAFAAMKAFGLGSNIMSLGGIAIPIGAMVDAAIVMIENAHKHLERASPGKPRLEILIEAASEVGPALFFSLLIITVSFVPIFTLEAQQGRLFSPLAYTKTFSMAAAALLSVTLVPALMVIFVRGRIVPEHRNPLNRLLIWLYRPMIKAVLKAKAITIIGALPVLGITLWPASQLGSGFMPSLDEAPCSICRPPCQASRSPRRRTCCNPRTASSNPFRKWCPSMARRAALRPPLTRRRPRCSRPSSTSSLRTSVVPALQSTR